MPYRGRYKLGDEVPLQVICKDSTGTPRVPDDVPVIFVYSGTEKLTNALMPILDRYGATGLFQYSLKLGSTYSVGHYSVAYTYVISGNAFTDTDFFEIVPGGHIDGNIISMTFYDRPHADFLVFQLDSGRLASGRNPMVN